MSDQSSQGQSSASGQPSRRGFLKGIAGAALGAATVSMSALSSGCGLLTNEVGPIEVRHPSWRNDALRRADRANPLGLRVASYNVHHFEGLDGKKDARRIAEVLQRLEPDVVALQETDMSQARDSDKLRVELIADILGLQVVSLCEDASYCWRGNAILTRYPINDVRCLDLSLPGRDMRGLADVEVAVDGQLVRIIGAHLGLDASERAHQITQMLNWLYAYPKRRGVVIMGDFNEWFGASANYDVLERYLGEARGPSTFPADAPIFHLDHIWTAPVDGLRQIGSPSDDVARSASDHRPMWGKIEL